MPDYYEILKVRTNASQSEIKAAYKKLALVHHPDRNQGRKESEEKFKLVYEAYKTLSNVSKRRLYDSKIHVYKPSDVKYTYHEGGFYRSILNRNADLKAYKQHKPEVFVSKKKDVDFYLFWFALGFILLLTGILILRF